MSGPAALVALSFLARRDPWLFRARCAADDAARALADRERDYRDARSAARKRGEYLPARDVETWESELALLRVSLARARELLRVRKLQALDTRIIDLREQAERAGDPRVTGYIRPDRRKVSAQQLALFDLAPSTPQPPRPRELVAVPPHSSTTLGANDSSSNPGTVARGHEPEPRASARREQDELRSRGRAAA